MGRRYWGGRGLVVATGSNRDILVYERDASGTELVFQRRYASTASTWDWGICAAVVTILGGMVEEAEAICYRNSMTFEDTRAEILGAIASVLAKMDVRAVP